MKWEHFSINLNAGSQNENGPFPEDWLEEMDKVGGELIAVDNGIAYYRVPKKQPVNTGPTEYKEVPNVPFV